MSTDRPAATPIMRKLIAFDADDLAIVSAHVQDARVRLADIRWRPREQRFVMALQRLDWDHMPSEAAPCARVLSALRFERVAACQSRGIALDEGAGEGEAVLNLLAVEYTPRKAAQNAPNAGPEGYVTLIFTGGGMLRLATDWAPYAEAMTEVLEHCTLLQNAAGAALYVDRPASRPLTRFERRGHRLGHEVFDLAYRRR